MHFYSFMSRILTVCDVLVYGFKLHIKLLVFRRILHYSLASSAKSFGKEDGVIGIYVHTLKMP